MQENVIEVQDLVKQFKVGGGPLKPKYEKIINGMSWHLKKGDHVAIIGQNGSGKTTLMKILAGIYLPDEGTVRVAGHDVKRELDEVLKKTSFVAPALSFLKKLSLRDILKFYGYSIGGEIEPAIKFLDDFGAGFMIDELAEVLSEGQKALLRFAIALLKDPEVMLIDEVTANLDVIKKEKLLNYLASKKDRISFIIIDHDVTTVDRLTNKLLMLKRGGTVMKLGDVNEILETIPYRYDVDVMPRRLIKKDYWDKYEQPWRGIGSHIQFICQTKKEVSELTTKLLDDKEVLSFTTSGLSIEDIYFFYLLNEDYASSEGIGRIGFEETTLF
ncbi:ATP-binding cassette domain-containing protein [Candidatus Bathyarchaeota archaeon]|nr:ATP-binding cassette domain-containing protein [Candidatus Bathyarchaeota archaeon]